MIRILSCCAVVLASLCACQSVPEDVNKGELVASRGVQELFASNDVDAVEAGERVRCVRHRRVGSHMIIRECRTIEEWEENERGTRELQLKLINTERACLDCGGDN